MVPLFPKRMSPFLAVNHSFHGKNCNIPLHKLFSRLTEKFKLKLKSIFLFLNLSQLIFSMIMWQREGLPTVTISTGKSHLFSLLLFAQQWPHLDEMLYHAVD